MFDGFKEKCYLCRRTLSQWLVLKECSPDARAFFYDYETIYLFHTLYILIGETFLFCKDTLFLARFQFFCVKYPLSFVLFRK